MLFLSKVVIPAVFNDFYILFYYRLYHFNLALFEAVIVNLYYFWYHIVFCFVTILLNVNMNGFMIITIELENKSKKNEYGWHVR